MFRHTQGISYSTQVHELCVFLDSTTTTITQRNWRWYNYGTCWAGQLCNSSVVVTWMNRSKFPLNFNVWQQTFRTKVIVFLFGFCSAQICTANKVIRLICHWFPIHTLLVLCAMEAESRLLLLVSLHKILHRHMIIIIIFFYKQLVEQWTIQRHSSFGFNGDRFAFMIRFDSNTNI